MKKISNKTITGNFRLFNRMTAVRRLAESIVMLLLAAVIVLAGCASVVLIKPPLEKEFIPADNPNIRYMGRVDFSKPGQVSFDWPGVSITAVFEGSYCGIALQDGGNDYNVFVDEKFQGVIETKNDSELYENIVGLSNGAHTLTITKRTEGSFGVGTFKGLYLEKGRSLLALPPSPTLNIEFIGDSITCGYGDEAWTLLCGTLRDYENNYLAYCSLAARELNAGYSIIASSGKGVVRNYGDPNRVSDVPMPSYYGRVLQNDPKSAWNFSSWTPQIVVINLGTNDYLGDPKPDNELFMAKYLELIGRVRTNYPGAEIFCLCGTMATWPQCDNIREVVRRSVESGDGKVHFVDTPFIGIGECGCNLHPNVVAHKTIADALVKEIRKYVKV